MYRKNWNFLLLGFIELWIWWLVYESFYTFQHVWPHIKYSWWSPTQWTARRTWRRRPGRLLTLQYITSVEIFLKNNVTLCLTTLNKCNLHYTVDAKHNVKKKTRDSGRKSGYITSVVFFLFFWNNKWRYENSAGSMAYLLYLFLLSTGLSTAVRGCWSFISFLFASTFATRPCQALTTKYKQDRRFWW